MEKKTVKVQVKNIGQSAQKLRLVADLVRGENVDKALGMLEFTNKKGSTFIKRAINSGIANAREKYGTTSQNLKISEILIDEAPTYKRGRFSARGRYSVISKRRSRINLELEVK